jgi:lipoate-protein ligase B
VLENFPNLRTIKPCGLNPLEIIQIERCELEMTVEIVTGQFVGTILEDPLSKSEQTIYPNILRSCTTYAG